ncbi:MAG: hypothetical protein H0W79_08725 [Rubrobacteraceae bacterium]|nr:hypothetical protein [Rubrobacteraceae bacterium]
MKTFASVVWISAAVLVALFGYMTVKSVCHECLTFPMAVVCERRTGDAADVQIESNRSFAGGYIKERQFAGCIFYWHEANTREPGD